MINSWMMSIKGLNKKVLRLSIGVKVEWYSWCMFIKFVYIAAIILNSNHILLFPIL